MGNQLESGKEGILAKTGWPHTRTDLTASLPLLPLIKQSKRILLDLLNSTGIKEVPKRKMAIFKSEGLAIVAPSS